MNKTEEKAYNYLKWKGWKPQETKPNKYNVGTPDFKCVANKYVEVKKINNMFHIECNENQVKKWYEMIKENKRVFLIIYNKCNKLIASFELNEGVKKL